MIFPVNLHVKVQCCALSENYFKCQGCQKMKMVDFHHQCQFNLTHANENTYHFPVGYFPNMIMEKIRSSLSE